MKLSDMHEANKLIDQLNRLKDRHIAINTPGRLGVTFDGRYQDESVLVEVIPVLTKQVNKEIWAVQEKLRQMGITVDC